MKILYLTGGAGQMYCGSCLRDNALATELLARGHEVTLLPVYTPTLTDETNVSQDRVFFGGISVYLEQYVPLFRNTPRWLDRLWDSRLMLKLASRRSISTSPKMLGEMTVSMLKGEEGFQHKEIEKLVEWLRQEPLPDVVSLPYSLLLGLAKPIKEALNRPICCTLQGEDLFLEGLIEPYRSRAIDLIRRQVTTVDRFIAVSDFYVPVMAKLLAIPESRISVVPLGINMNGYEKRGAAGDLFRVGYFARIAPEKGLHALAEAYAHFRKRTGEASGIRFEAAGYLGRADAPYLERVKRNLESAGLLGEFTYHGAVDRDGKLAFLKTLDVLSVPAPYDEPKGVFLLEAMACGVPVVQPRRGAFTEIVEKTGGGVLVAPDNPAALGDALFELWQDRAKATALGERGFHGVRAHYSVAHSADRFLEVCQLVSRPSGLV